MQWFHTAEDTMMSAVAKVYICKVLPARNTPDRLEEGTTAFCRRCSLGASQQTSVQAV